MHINMNRYTIGLPNIQNIGEYYYSQSNPLIRLWGCSSSIGHTNIVVIFSYIGNSKWGLHATQSNSDWLFITHSRVLWADWLISDNNEKASLHVIMPLWSCSSEKTLPTAGPIFSDKLKGWQKYLHPALYVYDLWNILGKPKLPQTHWPIDLICLLGKHCGKRI